MESLKRRLGSRERPFFSNLILIAFKGITSTDGYMWKEQRAFTFRYLKQYGFKKDTMELMILDEVNELVNHLKTGKLLTKTINLIIGLLSFITFMLLNQGKINIKHFRKSDEKHRRDHSTKRS